MSVIDEINAPRVVWDGTTAITAEEALGQPGERKDTAVGRVESFLTRLLADGPVLASVAKERAEEEGISRATLLRAKAALEIVSCKVGFEKGWHWRMPEAEDFEEEDAD